MNFLSLLVFSVCFLKYLVVTAAFKSGPDTSSIPLVTFGNKDYYFGVNVLITYFEAEQYCKDIDMELVKVESAAENNFLYNHIMESKTQEEHFWSAGSKVLNRYNWIWMTSAEVVNYTNWGSTEPNNPIDELCIELLLFKNKGLFYNDKRCEIRLAFICERETGSSEAIQSKESTNSFRYSTDQIPFVTFGEKRYYFGDVELTFFRAEQFCRDIDMELVRVESAQENDFLYRYVREKTKSIHFWTAGSKLVDNTNWIWMTTGEFVKYTNWSDGQPAWTDTGLCLELLLFKDKGLFFSNKPCEGQYNFICEKDNKRQLTQNDKKKNWASVFRNTNVSPRVNLLEFEDKTYYFGRHLKTTYFIAAQVCRMINMRQVSIDSTEENRRLSKYIRDTTIGPVFFSSATRSIDSKTWAWLPTGKKVQYFNWKTGPPSNPKVWCLKLEHQLDKGLFWVGTDCHDLYNFICENSDDGDVDPPTTTQKPTTTQEPPSEELYPGTTVNGTRYRLGKIKVIEEKASQICKEYGMELVSITDRETNNIVTDLIQKSDHHDSKDRYWTSGRKLSNGTWAWGGEQPLDYMNWDKDEPNNSGGKEECLHLYVTGLWNDVPCNVEYYFVCQSKCRSV